MARINGKVSPQEAHQSTVCLAIEVTQNAIDPEPRIGFVVYC